MAIGKAGKHQLALAVNDLSRSATVAGYVAIGPDRQDMSVLNRQRLRPRMPRIDGVDSRVE